jgi:hypothetical protein
MLTAVTYLGAVGLGVTSPQLFRADDGEVYVVKLQNNRLGTKVLVNEFLASRFAIAMDLCFPPGGLISIDEQVIQKSRRLRAAGVKTSPHFASKYLSNTTYVVRRNLFKAVNKSQMAGVMLFDHMFHNVDRTWNRKNLLARREDNRYVLYAIDNSHLFRRGRWNVDALARLERKVSVNYRRAYGWLLKYYLTAEDFYPYMTKVRALTDEALSDIVLDIPLEWLPREEERQALLKFMIVRRDMVDEIARRLYALIPNVHWRP